MQPNQSLDVQSALANQVYNGIPCLAPLDICAKPADHDKPYAMHVPAQQLVTPASPSKSDNATAGYATRNNAAPSIISDNIHSSASFSDVIIPDMRAEQIHSMALPPGLTIPVADESDVSHEGQGSLKASLGRPSRQDSQTSEAADWGHHRMQRETSELDQQKRQQAYCGFPSTGCSLNMAHSFECHF